MDVAVYGMGIASADFDKDSDFDYYVTNIGSNGGQEVLHLHFHIFAGEKVGKMVS